MAFGSELFLGFPHPEMVEVANSLSLTLDWEQRELLPRKLLTSINRKLVKPWINCVQNDLHLDVQRAEFSSGQKWRGWAITTPTKQYEVDPWVLELKYDPHEMQDDETQAILGISLITRYQPTFLDLEEYQHGGSGCMVALDKPTLEKIEFARAAIMTVLPQWKDAKICFKTLFY